MNSKKAKFLESIKGNKLKYKRVNMTPIRYAGGKSLACLLYTSDAADDC